MVEVLTILAVFTGITAAVTVPLVVLLAVPLGAWLVRVWLRLKEREVAIREHEFVLRMRESRAIPAWVDESDPASLMAWVKTDRELTAMEIGRR